MVHFMEIKLETRTLNHANLKRLKISELKGMLKEHTWKGEVISVDPDLKLLIKYILERKNVNCN